MEFRFNLSDDFIGGLLLGVVCTAALISCLFALSSPVPRKGTNQLGDEKLSNTGANGGVADKAAPAFNQANPAVSDWPHDYERRKDDREEEAIWWTRWDVRLTAIFSAALFAVALFQWLTMRQQGFYLRDEMIATQQSAKSSDESSKAAKLAADAATETVEQMRLQQRAWLNVLAPKLNTVSTIEPIRYVFAVRNYGKTHGNVIKHAQIAFIASESDDRLIQQNIDLLIGGIEKMPDEETYVAPESQYNLHVDSDLSLDQQMLHDISTGVRLLFLCCRVHYLDVFGKAHVSQRCFRYHPGKKLVWTYRRHNVMN